MTQSFHKTKPKARKLARKLKYELVNTNAPCSIVIDLGVDRVTELIKSVTGDNEDAFQDAWVEIISDHVASEEDILRLADDSLHKYSSERQTKIRREISPYTVIHESHQSFNDLTIGDMLEAPKPRTDEEIDHDIESNEQYVATSTGKVNRCGFVHLDWDTAMKLKALFPHDTYNSSIRKLVQLAPAERDKRPWYKWEDAIIKQRYPWGGARACVIDLFRSLNAINKRARFLRTGVLQLNHYKPNPNWLNIPELAEKLGCSYQVARSLEKAGRIKSIRIKDYHQGHYGVFFTPEAIEQYIKDEEYIKRRGEEIRINSLRKLEHGEYAVAEWGGKRQTHYIVLNSDNEVRRVCSKRNSIPLETIKKYHYNPFIEGQPSCQHCKRKI